MRTPRAWQLLATLAIVLAGGLWFPQVGSAHLDLVETTPAEGAALTEPVDQVVLRFTVPGEPAGPGIRILDGKGETLDATVRRSDDGTVFVARPATPLEGGRFGVAWRVAAPDAHPISGGFTFTVEAATPVAPPQDAAPAAPAPAEGGGTPAAATSSDGDPLAAALESPDDRGAKILSGFARALAYGGGLIAVGGLAFLAFAAVGGRREVAGLFATVRLAGLVALGGAVMGVVARAWLIDGDGPDAIASTNALGDALRGEAGLGLILTAAGGLAIAAGARMAHRRAPNVAIAAGSWDAYRPQRIVAGSISNSWLAVGGAIGIALGAALDGHTASEGPRALVWGADLLHFTAAGVWLGGIALLVALLVGRRRAGRHANAAYTAVRFATLAGAGSALAGLAGVVLAVIILPSFSALWESSWGLLLLAKVAVVALVAAMGAHNHFRLIPRLAARLDAAERASHVGGDDTERGAPAPSSEPTAGAVATVLRAEEQTAATHSPDQDDVARSLRRNAAAELVLLAVVVAITAALVGTSAV